MPHYEAVIFDLDGTLLDTVADIADAVNQALEAYGWNPQSLEKYRELVGAGLNELLELLLQDYAYDSSFFQAFRAEVVSAYTQRLTNKTSPYPGVHALLGQLQHQGFPRAVLSNKEHDKAHQMVDHFFRDHQLSPIMGAQPSFPIKPDPTSAVHIAQALALPPERIIYLGDTPTDVQTAQRAGMLPLGVAWGFRPEHELWEAGAYDVLKQPTALLHFLKPERF